MEKMRTTCGDLQKSTQDCATRLAGEVKAREAAQAETLKAQAAQKTAESKLADAERRSWCTHERTCSRECGSCRARSAPAADPAVVTRLEGKVTQLEGELRDANAAKVAADGLATTHAATIADLDRKWAIAEYDVALAENAAWNLGVACASKDAALKTAADTLTGLSARTALTPLRIGLIAAAAVALLIGAGWIGSYFGTPVSEQVRVAQAATETCNTEKRTALVEAKKSNG